MMTGTTHLLFAGENPFIRKFPIREGVVTYTTRGNQQGSQILYFSEYGRKQLLVEKQQNDNDIVQSASDKERVTLLLPDVKYLIYPEKKSAQKSLPLQKRLYDIFRKLTKQEQDKVLASLQKIAPRSYENISGSCFKEAKTIAGYRCNEELIGGIRSCTVANGGLTLEKRISLLGYSVDTFATEVKEKKVDPKIFTLPENLHIISDTQKSDPAPSKIIANLLSDPKGCRKRTGSGSGENLHLILYEEIKNLSGNL